MDKMQNNLFIVVPVVYFFLLQLSFISTQVVDQCPGIHCNRFCHRPEGTCLPSGQCLCRPGFTGPNAKNSSRYPGQVEADHCLKTCHPLLEGMPCDSKCDQRCNGYNKCLPNGRCLCWWGWTGPNAFYASDGPYENRIVADFCDRSCTYGIHYSNPWCAQAKTVVLNYL